MPTAPLATTVPTEAATTTAATTTGDLTTTEETTDATTTTDASTTMGVASVHTLDPGRLPAVVEENLVEVTLYSIEVASYSPICVDCMSLQISEHQFS